MTLHRPDISLLISLLGSLLFFILGAILPACGHLSHSSNPACQSLRRIAKIVADHPHRALDSLKAIDYSRLSTSDRHYYDFLSVKGADKAFVTHTSDSLILDVIDYYSSHKTEEHYPEALYYGGRVYSDLGDYPTALRYFQQALELLPSETEQKNLRRRVLSQTAYVLSTLRLYPKAIPYIEESLRLDKLEKDTVAIMRDIQLLGTVYLHLKDLDNAEARFREALHLTKDFMESDIARLHMYIAATKHKKGENDSARLYITGVLDHIRPTDRHVALAYLGYIYLNSNRPDSAYIAARELISLPSLINRDKGYYILTSPQLVSQVPIDTLAAYLRDYHKLIGTFLDTNSNEEALLQSSRYNYSLHERGREKAETSYNRLLLLIFSIAVVTLLFSVIFLIWLNRKRKLLTNLMRASLLIKEYQVQHHYNNSSASDYIHAPWQESTLPYLPISSGDFISKSDGLPCNNFSQHKLPQTTSSTLDSSSSSSDTRTTPSSPTDNRPPLLVSNVVDLNDPSKLREKIIAELRELNKTLGGPYEVPLPILQSDVYEKLQSSIHSNSAIGEKSEVWLELEQVVTDCFPNLKRNLNIIWGHSLKKDYFRFILLVKCGISTTQISTLQARGKSTIIYRRDKLSIKIFGEKLPLTEITRVLQYL